MHKMLTASGLLVWYARGTTRKGQIEVTNDGWGQGLWRVLVKGFFAK